MLRKFLRGDDTIFTLLESSSKEVRQCAVLLKELIPHLGEDAPDFLENIRQSRRLHKKISQEITETLCRTFITPLDREDIEALSASLNKIPKTIEKIAERLAACPGVVTGDFVTRQVTLLDRGTREVMKLVHGLRKKEPLEIVRRRQDKLQLIEGDGDKMLLTLLSQLYAKRENAVEIIILKDLYELLEKAIDRCRDCGNVVFQVVLKYS